MKPTETAVLSEQKKSNPQQITSEINSKEPHGPAKYNTYTLN